LKVNKKSVIKIKKVIHATHIIKRLPNEAGQ